MPDFEKLWTDLKHALEVGAEAPLHAHEQPGFTAALECMRILEEDAGVPEHLEEKRAVREADNDGADDDA